MKQMTKEQAIALWNSKRWLNWTTKQIVDLQLYQERICFPFTCFHEALEAELGRPVLIHELGQAGRIIEELEGKQDSPTLHDIREMLPLEKFIEVII